MGPVQGGLSDRRGVIGVSVVGHTKAIPIVKHQITLLSNKGSIKRLRYITQSYAYLESWQVLFVLLQLKAQLQVLRVQLEVFFSEVLISL